MNDKKNSENKECKSRDNRADINDQYEQKNNELTIKELLIQRANRRADQQITYDIAVRKRADLLASAQRKHEDKSRVIADYNAKLQRRHEDRQRGR